MSALSELLDKNNWSNFAWYGERSLSLEVVPELEQEFNKLLAALEEAREILRHCAMIWGSAPGEAASWLSAHPAQQEKDFDTRYVEAELKLEPFASAHPAKDGDK